MQPPGEGGLLWRVVNRTNVSDEAGNPVVNTSAYFYKKERNASVFIAEVADLDALQARWPTRGVAQFSQADAVELGFVIDPVPEGELSGHAHLCAAPGWSNGEYRAKAAELADRSIIVIAPTD